MDQRDRLAAEVRDSVGRRERRRTCDQGHRLGSVRGVVSEAEEQSGQVR
jgi:hypothetical protein